MFKRPALVLLGLLCLLPSLAGAAQLDQLKSDFKSFSGVVVMPIGEEYLIDLDASRGVMEGDLFSVVVPGERVLHPVTGEVLGTLDQVKGFLQVTRVRSGYSYARPVGKETQFAKGDAIRRFDNVKAAFWDYSGDGQGLFAELRAALPTLVWQSYAEAQALRPENPKPLPGGEPPLVFIHRAGTLEVRGASFQILHSYATAAPSAVAPPVAAVPVPVPVPVPATSGIVAAAPAEPGAGGGIVRAEKSQWAGVKTVMEIDGEATGVEVADLDGDGRQEAALLEDGQINLVRFSAQGRENLARLDLSRADKYLTIDAADLDGDGLPELYVTAVKNLKPASLAVQYANGQLQVRETGIAYFLRVVNVPGEGRILLGQELGTKLETYGKDLYRMQYAGGQLTKGPVFTAPWKVQLFGFTPFRSQQGNTLYADLSTSSRLRVLQADAEELWQSSQVYGGSNISFQRPDYSGGPGDSLHEVRIQPRLELGSSGEVLVPSNGGPGLVSTSLSENRGPGSIYAMEWDGSAMRELWHTRPQEGYMADFRLADIDNDGRQELAMLMVVSAKGMFNKGHAALVAYDLQ